MKKQSSGFKQQRDQQQNQLKVDRVSSSHSRQTNLEKRQSKPTISQQQSGRTHLVSHTNTQSGDGLWCAVKEVDHFEPGKYDKFAEKVVSKKTKVADNRVESLIVEGLEKQCVELGNDLEKANTIAREKNLENFQLKQIIDNLNKTINEQMTEIMHLRNSNRTSEEQQDELRDKYNEIQRNHSKLQADYDEEKDKATTYKQFYEELKQETDEKIKSLQNKLLIHQEQADELAEQNEDLMSKMQTKQQLHQKIDNQRQQKFQDQTMRQVQESERKLEKMGKLLEENAVLQEKLGESEVLKRKFMEKNKLLDKEIRKIAQEKLESDKQLVQNQKRIKDLSVMKSTGNKVLEDKINKLNEKVTGLEKENKTLQKQLEKAKKQPSQAQSQYEDEEEMYEVQAKPQLFGPIDTGKF